MVVETAADPKHVDAYTREMVAELLADLALVQRGAFSSASIGAACRFQSDGEKEFCEAADVRRDYLRSGDGGFSDRWRLVGGRIRDCGLFCASSIRRAASMRRSRSACICACRLALTLSRSGK